MAQNLLISGVTYPSVASLSVAKSGGGVALFPDTSGANAAAADIKLNKTAVVNGVLLTGTNQGFTFPASVAAGSSIIYADFTSISANSSSYSTQKSYTIHLAGTYTITYNVSSSYSGRDAYIKLRKNGVDIAGTEISTYSAYTTIYGTVNVACAVNDVIQFQLKAEAWASSELRVFSIAWSEHLASISGIIT